ncbi:MAG: hypothetical protein IJM15_04795 [Erysipelotrichaceae bacterium]|nr:hypothetical protein [Erysipelotrichaceae bacterium]
MADEKKPALANLNNYWAQMREEGEEDERKNEGYVWTINVSGTQTINAIIAKMNYTLNLSCSHIGNTPYGVYRGEMSFKVDGDIKGTKLMLLALGIRSKEDVDGWFRNDQFIMRVKPYEAKDVSEFVETFNPAKEQAELPADADQNEAIKQATTEAVNNLIDSFLGNLSQKEETKSDNPIGLWYDWDTHMTEGDLGMFLKINGGLLYWYVNGSSATDASGGQLFVDESAVVLGKVIKERYDEVIGSPFPYTLKIYDNGQVLFTLYNSKGGPVTVDWLGTIDRIPVEETITVK